MGTIHVFGAEPNPFDEVELASFIRRTMADPRISGLQLLLAISTRFPGIKDSQLQAALNTYCELVGAEVARRLADVRPVGSA